MVEELRRRMQVLEDRMMDQEATAHERMIEINDQLTEFCRASRATADVMKVMMDTLIQVSDMVRVMDESLRVMAAPRLPPPFGTGIHDIRT